MSRKKSPTPRKLCSSCKKEKAINFFFKVDSPLFPDGSINTCRDCVRKDVDVDNLEEVISFLRQIDKPFKEDYWKEAVNNKQRRHPLGEYIRKVNSLTQLKGKTFDNSSGMQVTGKTVDIELSTLSDTVTNIKDEVIEYSDELVDKWGIGYKKQEYLKLEKFYQDMRITHEIHTPVHVDQLMQLAYMSVDRDRIRISGDWNNYTKVSSTIETMIKSAGFRPVDRQSLDDATGIRSFSQIWEEVEKRGFRKPPVSVFNRDIIDAQIISLANYYHRIVGMQILQNVPEDIREELDEFYIDDLTPVEINDEEYDDLDFSTDDSDE